MEDKEVQWTHEDTYGEPAFIELVLAPIFLIVAVVQLVIIIFQQIFPSRKP